jgi:tight adherence protein B
VVQFGRLDVLLSLGIFACVTVGITAGYFVVTGLLFRDASLVRRRVETEFGKGGSAEPARSALFPNLDQLDLDRPAPEDPEAAGPPPVEEPRGLRGRLRLLLDQANLKVTPGQLLTVAGCVAVVLGAAGLLLRGPLLGAAGVVGGAAAPLVYVWLKRRARREKLLAQLPGAFDLMARVIRSGQSVPQSLQAVADAFEDPVAAEFADCQKQQGLGLRPESAFHDFARRTGILEVRIFVMALLIQRQTGGNMAEVLERLAGLLRERQRLRRRVRTLTAEGRLQGVTLLVLPFVVFGAMMAVNRAYAEALLEHTSLLAIMGAVMSVGALWIHRIVNFEP